MEIVTVLKESSISFFSPYFLWLSLCSPRILHHHRAFRCQWNVFKTIKWAGIIFDMYIRNCTSSRLSLLVQNRLNRLMSTVLNKQVSSCTHYTFSRCDAIEKAEKVIRHGEDTQLFRKTPVVLTVSMMMVSSPTTATDISKWLKKVYLKTFWSILTWLRSKWIAMRADWC